jgi:hypothetical protein
MYRKKSKKMKERSDAEKEKIVGETAIRVINMLRQAGEVIPDALCPTQPTHIGSSEQEDASVSEEEDVHGSGEEHGPFNENEANVQHSDSRSSMLDTIDALTEPTKCSLLDGTGHNLELAVATVYHIKRLAIMYRCRKGMQWCNLLMCGPIRVTSVYLCQ